MKKMLIIVISLLFSQLSANEMTVQSGLKALNRLTNYQRVILYNSYEVGEDYDLSLTLAAIAWEESNFGKYKMNLQDGNSFKFKGSYGPYHILLHTVCKQRDIKSYWAASRIAERLISDPELSGDIAIEQLLLWKKYWENRGVKSVWSHMVASYNNGVKSYSDTVGKRYLKRIRVKIRALRYYATVKK